eukprot:PhM_4_TR3116/c0_g1_i1/m.21962/K16458/CEP104; centrosomal protein CEP104
MESDPLATTTSENIRCTIARCSAEDEGYPASNMLTPTVNNNMPSPGWRSSKLCEYPVEIVIRFDGEVEMRALQLLSHETMIARKIEIFICRPDEHTGQVKRHPNLAHATFARLGYISLSANEATNYSARELKTVQLGHNTTAVYLKLVLHQCHVNAHNYFNQVGLVSVGVVGDLTTPYVSQALTMSMEPEMPLIDQAMLHHPQNSDAQETYSAPPQQQQQQPFDKETEQKLKELALLKAQAVEVEDYDAAKRHKVSMDKIRDTAKRLMQLEQEKKSAVMKEDYDKAKELKTEIDTLKRELAQINPHNRPQPQPPLFPQQVPAAPPVPVPMQQQQQPTSPIAAGLPPLMASEPPARFDDLPAVSHARAQQVEESEVPEVVPPPSKPINVEDIVNHPNPFNVGASNEGQRIRRDDTAAPGAFTEAAMAAAATGGNAATFDVRALPEWERKIHSTFLKIAPDHADVEDLSADKLREMSEIVSLFGEYLGRALSSKRFQTREGAIKVIAAEMDSFPQGPAKAVAGLMRYMTMKGVGLADPIQSTYSTACDFTRQCIEGKYDAVAAGTVGPAIVTVLPQLLLKASDNQQKVRETASTLILMAAGHKEVGVERVAGVVVSEPKDPKKPKAVNFRLYTSRLSILMLLLDKFGGTAKSSPPSLMPDNVMSVLVSDALQHANNEVRELAVRVTVRLCKTHGHVMDKYLNGLKPALRQVIDDKLEEDAGPAPAAGKGFQEGEMASQSFSVQQGQGGLLAAAREANKATAAAGSPPKPKPKPKTKPLTPEEKAERTCQFCGNFDERYNESLMDLHFVRSCPMLAPCPLCVQVIEIAMLQEHLNDECEKRFEAVRKCPRCGDAIKISEYDQHVDAAVCLEQSPSFAVCPLCKGKVSPPTDDGWAAHLLKAPGCPKNPRGCDGKDGGEFE